jgi:hypothetical protein
VARLKFYTVVDKDGTRGTRGRTMCEGAPGACSTEGTAPAGHVESGSARGFRGGVTGGTSGESGGPRRVQ